MSGPHLVVFDVDGTLVDSQGHILAAMAGAFDAHGLVTPRRDEVLAIVGLSLPVAMAQLMPDRPDLHASLVEAYKDNFVLTRKFADPAQLSPLYPGAAAALAHFGAQDDVVLGIATGKSRRGLDVLMELHGWDDVFRTVQVADDHPSKPHPSMVQACMAETGTEAAQTVMIGDTTFDIEMGRAAGVRTIGVSWGYHGTQDLHDAGADVVIDDFAALPSTLGAGLHAS